jgi:two-component system chemotaxis sensor kinase CheA
MTADESPFTQDAGLRSEFVHEVREHLEGVEHALLALDEQPADPEAVNALFRAFHTIKGGAALLGLAEMAALGHDVEELLDRLRCGQSEWSPQVRAVVAGAAEAVSSLADRAEQDLGEAAESECSDLVLDLVHSIRELVAGGTAALPTSGPSAAAAAPSVSSAEPRPLTSALGAFVSAPPGPAAARPPSGGAIPTLRVDARKLDRLMEASGELLTSVSIARLAAASRDGERLETALARLGRLGREVQDMAASLRMISLRRTFQRMTRLVNDLAQKLGKPIAFEASGEDTRLDKSIVERLSEPLLHLLRNAVDHGIEPSEELRRANGKPTAGRIWLRAFQRAGRVFIEVEDDGRGLDAARILETARACGVRVSSASVEDVYGLIYTPGLSTAREVTAVSGRGVGMDAVKVAVESLHGTVSLATKPGRGTCFTLSLPLTVAVLDGMVLRAASQRFVLPTLNVVCATRLLSGCAREVPGLGEFVVLERERLPLLRLGRLFGCDDAQCEDDPSTLVVVEDNHQKLGLLVEEVVGQQQVVIKQLGTAFAGIPILAGGTVLPDGGVGLILDVGGLFHSSTEKALSRAG